MTAAADRYVPPLYGPFDHLNINKLAWTLCLRAKGRFAPIPVAHEPMSVFVKSYQ